jgi:hypothetical protein
VAVPWNLRGVISFQLDAYSCGWSRRVDYPYHDGKFPEKGEAFLQYGGSEFESSSYLKSVMTLLCSRFLSASVNRTQSSRCCRCHHCRPLCSSTQSSPVNLHKFYLFQRLKLLLVIICCAFLVEIFVRWAWQPFESKTQYAQQDLMQAQQELEVSFP